VSDYNVLLIQSDVPAVASSTPHFSGKLMGNKIGIPYRNVAE